MYNKLTKTAESALSQAVKLAKRMGHTYVGTEHLLLGLLSEKGCIASKILVSRGIEFDTVSDMIEESVGFGEVTDVTSKDMSPRAKTVIGNASYEAMKYSSVCVGTDILFRYKQLRNGAHSAVAYDRKRQYSVPDNQRTWRKAF